MKLKQLGNGGGLDFTQTNASFLIETAQDDYLLFDCGFNIMQELISLDKSEDPFLLINLNTVFVSHMHEDHIGNLTGLIYHRYFMYNKHTNIVSGPKVVDQLHVYLKLLCSNVYKSSTLIEANMFKWGSRHNIHALEGNHKILPSYGMILQHSQFHDSNSVLFISGDTKADIAIEQELRRYGLNKLTIFHDFSNWNAPSSNPHMCQSDMEAEYTTEFISKLNLYHDGRQDFNREWISI